MSTIVGAVLVAYGVIAAISPLPAGVPLVILGLMMIAAANPAARPLIRRMRRKWRWFDAIVRRLGASGPKGIREVAEATRPIDTGGGMAANEGEEHK